MLTNLFDRSSGSHILKKACLGFTVFLCLLSLSSCSQLKKYDVTFNDSTLYSPQPLFSEYRIADQGLATCVEQAIEDFEVYTEAGLEVLNCSNAGISSLIGLSQFRNLKRLKLSGNDIRNLVELSVMTNLVEVQVDGNNIVDSVPLTALPSIKDVNLAHNPALQCPGLMRFPAHVRIVFPEHCRS